MDAEISRTFTFKDIEYHWNVLLILLIFKLLNFHINYMILPLRLPEKILCLPDKIVNRIKGRSYAITYTIPASSCWSAFSLSLRFLSCTLASLCTFCKPNFIALVLQLNKNFPSINLICCFRKGCPLHIKISSYP